MNKSSLSSNFQYLNGFKSVSLLGMQNSINLGQLELCWIWLCLNKRCYIAYKQVLLLAKCKGTDFGFDIVCIACENAYEGEMVLWMLEVYLTTSIYMLCTIILATRMQVRYFGVYSTVWAWSRDFGSVCMGWLYSGLAVLFCGYLQVYICQIIDCRQSTIYLIKHIFSVSFYLIKHIFSAASIAHLFCIVLFNLAYFFCTVYSNQAYFFCISSEFWWL